MSDRSRARRFGEWMLVRIDRLLFAGAVNCQRAKFTVRKLIKDHDDTDQVQIAKKARIAKSLSDHVVARLEDRELERLRSLESKAKTNLIGITLAFSLVSAGTKFWLDGIQNLPSDGPVRFVLLGSVVLAGIYFFMAGLHALAALGVGSLYQPSPDDYAYGDHAIDARLFYLEQNQLATTLRSNALSVSFNAIGNGIVALAAGVLAVVWSLVSAAYL